MLRILFRSACLVWLSSSILVAQVVTIPGPIDIDSLRKGALQHAATASGLPFGLLAPFQAAQEPSAAETWGFDFMDVPAIFVRSTAELQRGPGMLIIGVCENSPAWKAGMRRGQVLLEVDGHRLGKPSDLPALTEAHCATILTDEGFKKIQAIPSPRWLRRVVSPLANPFAQPTEESLSQPPNSAVSVLAISMSEVNGNLVCTAIVTTQEGQKEVHLQGSRSEMETQLKNLSADVQAVLRPQIGF